MDDPTAIIDVTIRYCWALDDRDWAGLDDVFAPDATARLDQIDCPDRASIVARCRATLEPLDSSHHLVSNHRVVVDGDGASSECYLQAQHTRRGLDGGDNFLLGGRYFDVLARTGDGWRITHRRLVVVWTEGNPRVLFP